MRIEIYQDPIALGRAEAQQIAELLKEKPDALLCVPAGQSGNCVYDQLIEMNRRGEVDFSRCYFVGLDEWCDYDNYAGSAGWILDNSFFNHVNVKRENMRMFNPNPKDPEQECREIEAFIEAHGGIDYLLLGVGMNGHVALNEPGVDLRIGAHIATLAEKTKQVSERYFENGMPPLTRGLTLGYRNIFAARQVVVILNGAHKAPIVKSLLEKPITNTYPVTNIKACEGARIVMDEAAAQDFYRV